ncbi:MAG: S8 family serine peptidase [bacterium]|nr:S8 family serine peptidase [bacterium]
MNRRVRIPVFVCVSLLLAALAAPISALPDEVDAELRPYHPDRVLVRIVDGTPPGVLGPDAEHIFGRWYVVSALPGEDAADEVQRLESLRHIEVADVDRVVRLDPQHAVAADFSGIESVSPNDPLYYLQWHLPVIDAPDAWEMNSGSGVVVAIVDSGISFGGNDLDCRPLAGEFNAFTNTAAPGAGADDNGHGTHVAGTVGQCTNNSVGVAGVAGSASLMAVKVLDATGGGYSSYTAAGIVWAAANGADIINLSLSGTCPSAIHFDAVDTAIAAGVVVIAATGNDAKEPGYAGEIGSPACHPDVIAVGATDYDDDRSPFSNWGIEIDVVAPGGDMGADNNGDGRGDGVLQETFDPSDPSDWGYWWFEGTSMATPHVSGTAALMLSANPAATADQVKKALEVTATDRGASGWDMYYGHGLIDAEQAIDAVLDTEAPSWSSGSTVSVSPDETSADLSWPKASDNIAVTDYVISLDGSPAAVSSTNSYELTGLSPGTSYSVAVQAGDLMENWSAVGSATPFTTGGTIDNVAPTWPGGSSIDASIIGDDWIYFEWDIATDNVDVTDYHLYRNGTLALTTSDTYATVEGLSEGTTYEFTVEASDAAGNTSATGPSLTATTVDWTFPEWAGGGWLTAAEILEDRATLSWAAATDPSGIAEYRIWVDSEYHTTTGATTLTVTGFDPDTEYLAWVEAEDPSGNWSFGPELWFTTALDFSDTGDSNFATDIAWLSGAGITKGCNPPLNTDFCPESYVTRGQMAAFLVRALGYSDDGGGDLFGDDDDSVFEGDIDRLGTAGVTLGCNPPSNSKFCPESYVTRGQMAAFLVRALGYSDDGGGDLFGDDDDSVFEDAIDRLGTAGITRGCDPPANKNFCPDARVTRGQMAAFLHRALGGT